MLFRHLTESKIYTDTKAKDQLAMGEKVEPTAQAEAIVPLPAAITAVVKPSLNIGASLAALWEFKYVLIGTASTWFLMDGALYEYVYPVTDCIYTQHLTCSHVLRPVANEHHSC